MVQIMPTFPQVEQSHERIITAIIIAKKRAMTAEMAQRVNSCCCMELQRITQEEGSQDQHRETMQAVDGSQHRIAIPIGWKFLREDSW